jgi:hypothetical protein
LVLSLALGTLAVPIARCQAQAWWISADIGLAPISARSPYSSSLAGIARAGVAVRLVERVVVELEAA